MFDGHTKSAGGAQRSAAVLVSVALAASAPAAAALADPPAAPAVRDEAALADELDLLRRRGDLDDATLADLDALLEEEGGGAELRLVRARARFERCDHEGAVEDARRALAGASGAGAAEAARTLGHYLVELGRAEEALSVLAPEGGGPLDPGRDARDAWALGRARLAAGEREAARELFLRGAEAPRSREWRHELDRALCQRARGDVQAAARSLVRADLLAREADGTEPDVLMELGDLYFEVYGEIDDPVSRAHSPEEQYREALSLHPEHEGALLGLFELHRFNWQLRRTSPEELLERVLARRPDSIPGLLASASADIDDGRLPSARRALDRLAELAPGRRDVRAERAALHWVEHERDECRDALARLAAEDPADSRPERVVARHLNELYRWEEALSFARGATERDPGDWLAWTELARSLANTGDEEAAREAFASAAEAARGRRNAWRENTARVLERIHAEYVVAPRGEHTFVWKPDAAEVLERYLVPFYAHQREELARRYGHTPGPVRIEVFRRWSDFSVRSTGFEGFAALGVCFGPVVTAVSPLAEIRGEFSWARTAYHEYTHVVHLALSHNRCPRWFTEGLATWEEEERSGAWSRNMRREVLDARANGTIIPVRELNRAFRTQRILFAYYQGGLLVRMLIEEAGFGATVRVLDAFDRGLDLDAALREVYDTTPEDLDARFLEWLEERFGDLRIEPRWRAEAVVPLRLSLGRRPSEDEAERAKWQEGWCTIGWHGMQRGRRADAEDALRTAGLAGELPPRGHFLRGEIALSRDDRGAAREAFERGLELGGEDFRVRIALGAMAEEMGELERAEAHYAAAERAFPGFSEGAMPPAELALARLHEMRGETELAMEARMRWLAHESADYPNQLAVARWLDDGGRTEEAVEFYRRANEIDPFSRELHLAWGRALAALGRDEEALREFEVGLLVPIEHDRDVALAAVGAGSPVEAGQMRQAAAARWGALEPELRAARARALAALGRDEEAREAARAALELDESNEEAKRVLDRSR